METQWRSRPLAQGLVIELVAMRKEWEEALVLTWALAQTPNMRVNTIVGLFFLPVVLGAASSQPSHEAIFEMSESAPRDAAVQKKALAAIDAEIAKQPKEALGHFVRGKILTRLGRDADSLAAYDEAVRLDAKLANAQYNAGIVLGRLGRKKEAAERFDLALEIEPLPDAAYNAGQAYYDLKDFETALKRFERAHKLAPGDFDSARKVMQAQMALGREKDAWKTRETVLKIWKKSSDPAVRQRRDYVLEQFEIGGLHVMAAETLAPAEELAYIYTFKVYGAQDKLLGSVQLETSAVIREMGWPYLMGVSKPKSHQATGIGFKSLPRYSEVRETAVKLIREHFEAPAPQ